MTRATIPARGKHIYFYALLVLATVAFATILTPAESVKSQNKSRATAHRLPLSQRTTMLQGSVSQAPSPELDHIWKLSLLGLAALGFLIRKRL